ALSPYEWGRERSAVLLAGWWWLVWRVRSLQPVCLHRQHAPLRRKYSLRADSVNTDFFRYTASGGARGLLRIMLRVGMSLEADQAPLAHGYPTKSNAACLLCVLTRSAWFC